MKLARLHDRIDGIGPVQPAVQPQTLWKGPDCAVRTLLIELTREHKGVIQKAARSRLKGSLMRIFLQGQGIVAEPGHCSCRVCAQDGDCCGRMVPSMYQVRKVKGRTYRVTQTYYRNV